MALYNVIFHLYKSEVIRRGGCSTVDESLYDTERRMTKKVMLKAIKHPFGGIQNLETFELQSLHGGQNGLIMGMDGFGKIKQIRFCFLGALCFLIKCCILRHLLGSLASLLTLLLACFGKYLG